MWLLELIETTNLVQPVSVWPAAVLSPPRGPELALWAPD